MVNLAVVVFVGGGVVVRFQSIQLPPSELALLFLAVTIFSKFGFSVDLGFSEWC